MSESKFSPTEFLALGQNYYDSGKWSLAQTAFSDGLELQEKRKERPMIELLEYRSRSHQKQSQFARAIQDGLAMTKQFKTDKRGYLRICSALEASHKANPRPSMDDLHTAVKVLKTGVNRVAGSHQDCLDIQTRLLRIQRSLTMTTGVDPFDNVLPFELLDMIINYTSFQDMVVCLRVSKVWRQYIESRSLFWRNLDMSSAVSRKHVSKDFIRRAAHFSRNQLSQIIMKRVDDNRIISRLAQSCPNLQIIKILDGGQMSETLIQTAQRAHNLHTLSVYPNISLDAITQILRYRPTITNAEFTAIMNPAYDAKWYGPFPNLQTLTLCQPTAVMSIKTVRYKALLAEAPNLRSLKLENWTNITRELFDFMDTGLTSIILKNVALTVFPLLPRTLQRFELQPMQTMRLKRTAVNLNAETSWRHAIMSLIPQLTVLKLSNLSDLDASFFEKLLDGHSHDGHEDNFVLTKDTTPLEEISIRNCTMAPDNSNLFGNGGPLSGSPRILTEALEAIDLANLPVSDNDIDNLVSKHPVRPTTVNLGGTAVTESSVDSLVRVEGCRLAALVVDQCHNITSRRAIDFAGARGVKVSWRMGKTALSGGKTVRY